MANILNLNGSLNDRAAATSLLFSNLAHPADLYRVSKQTDLLKKLGWWAEIRNSKSNTKRVLEHSMSLKLSSFSVPSFDLVQSPLLDALDRMVSEIVSAVEDSLSGLDSGVEEYILLKGIVREYLVHGVVPSVVPDPNSRRTTNRKKRNPSPVTILNVSYQLYLDDLSELIERISNQSASSVADRMKWTQRLETWTY